MATLHVRNVPDELYERLRASAAEEGRSIGGQAVELLRCGLADRRDRRRQVEHMLVTASPFRRRFANHAQDLVLRAQEVARESGSTETTPAHVLQAMLEDDALRPALERGGVTHASVRAALPPPAEPGTSPPPVSADARRMLEQALLQSLGLQQP
jgi:plasmid stability protein